MQYVDMPCEQMFRAMQLLNTYAAGCRICEEEFAQCNIQAWPLHDNMHSVRLMTINYANDDVGSSDKLEAQERDVFSGWGYFGMSLEVLYG